VVGGIVVEVVVGGIVVEVVVGGIVVVVALWPLEPHAPSKRPSDRTAQQVPICLNSRTFTSSYLAWGMFA
ncbi:unnamed protein product, partial [Acidithrix sp. C25]